MITVDSTLHFDIRAKFLRSSLVPSRLRVDSQLYISCIISGLGDLSLVSTAELRSHGSRETVGNEIEFEILPAVAVAASVNVSSSSTSGVHAACRISYSQSA